MPFLFWEHQVKEVTTKFGVVGELIFYNNSVSDSVMRDVYKLIREAAEKGEFSATIFRDLINHELTPIARILINNGYSIQVYDKSLYVAWT